MPSLTEQQEQENRTPEDLDTALARQADLEVAKAVESAGFNDVNNSDDDGEDGGGTSQDSDFVKPVMLATATAAIDNSAGGSWLDSSIDYAKRKLRNSAIKKLAQKAWQKIRGNKGKTLSKTASEAGESVEKGAAGALEKGIAEAAPGLAQGALKVGAEVVGRGVEVVYVGKKVYDAQQAVSQGDFRGAAGDVGDAGGFLAGAAAGGWGGAALGTALGIESGPGAILTGAAGGLVGGLVGGFAGEKATQAFFDRIKDKLPEWMRPKDNGPRLSIPAPKEDLQAEGLHTLASYIPSYPSLRPHVHDYSGLEQKGPPGIAYNNPGNLRGNDEWQGKVGVGKGGYLVFDSEKNGLRALAVNTRNQQDINGLKTVEQIITRYAPASDHNCTEAYITNVCVHMGVNRNEEISLHNPKVLASMMEAIVIQENGRAAGLAKYTLEMIREAANEGALHLATTPRPNRQALRTQMADAAPEAHPTRHDLHPHGIKQEPAA